MSSLHFDIACGDVSADMEMAFCFKARQRYPDLTLLFAGDHRFGD
jgi:hypothetical protein